MNNFGLALCKHDNKPGLYLFRMPEYERIEAGDKVVVDTKIGKGFATVVQTVCCIDEEYEECKMILKLAGVEKAEDLKRVLRKVVFKELKYSEEDE